MTLHAGNTGNKVEVGFVMCFELINFMLLVSGHTMLHPER
jgi:hypothetical protein